MSTHNAAMTSQEFAEIRADLNLSYDAMAGLLGVDARSVYRYERGDSVIQGPISILMRAYYSKDLKINRKSISDHEKVIDNTA